MSFATFLTLRNSNLTQLTSQTVQGSTIRGNIITASTLTLTSTTIGLGASTNQSYINYSNGSYASTSWVTSLSSLTSTTKVSMNQNATTILVARANSSTISTSVNAGVTWSSLTGANGLPAGATAYPIATATGTPNYTSLSQSATGQYVLAAVSGGLLYTSLNYGANFTAVGPTAPTVYLPMEGTTNDAMGSVTVTASNSPGYVTGVVGTQALYLNNASPGSTASQYVRFPISLTATPNFTVSFWLYATSLPGTQQTSVLDIGTSGTSIIGITIATNGRLDLQWLTSTSSYGSSMILSSISLNTWYNVTMSYTYNGTCYLYLNNVLANSFSVNFSLYTSMNLLGLGSRVTDANYAFKGYLDDFRYYNTALTFNPIMPMNWVQTAVSASGQYQLAAATTGGLYLSTNYGVTWTMVVNVGGWIGLSVSSTGQYMVACSTTAGYAPYYSINYGATWTTSTFNGTAGSFIALSGNGQYSLTGYATTALLITNYLAGYTTATYTTPTFSPSIGANIMCASISTTGQYMVLLTVGSTNNVYYSTNYGVSFTGLTVGSSAMTSCAISYDGTYITVSNATTVYTLNLNSVGYTIAVGSQAGAVNQGRNAVAIGNQAGLVNQAASSIVMNATGAALNAYEPGLFVAPVSAISNTAVSNATLLGYGTDSQITQVTGVYGTANGYVGIGTSAPSDSLVVNSGSVAINNGGTTHAGYLFNQNTVWGGVDIEGMSNTGAQTINIGVNMNRAKAWSSSYNGLWFRIDSRTTSNYNGFHFFNKSATSGTESEIMTILSGGNVGIGTATPTCLLYITSATYTKPVLVLDSSSVSGSTAAPSAPRGVGQPLLGIGNLSYTTPGPAPGDYYGIGFGYNASLGTNYYPAEIGLYVQNTGGQTYGDLVFSARSVTSNTVATERMRITGGGNVGIGTNNPSYPLHIYTGNALPFMLEQSTTTANYMAFKSNGTVYGFFGLETSAGSGLFGNNTGYGMSIGTPTATNFNVATGNVVRMTIASGGNVGIGTTSPNNLLHIHGGQLPTTPLIISNTSNVNQQLMFGTSWGGAYSSSYSSVQSIVQGTAYNALSLNALGGNVGIGMTNPAQTLDVNGTIARNGFKLPRVDYGTISSANSINIPILFSDTQYNMVEIRIRYLVSAQTSMNFSGISTASVAMNIGEAQYIYIQYNQTTPTYGSANGGTAMSFATNVETAGIDNNALIRITRASGVITVGLRNHYTIDNVYCWYGVGTTRATAMGHFDCSSVGGPALASFNIACVNSSAQITGTYSTTHYN